MKTEKKIRKGIVILLYLLPLISYGQDIEIEFCYTSPNTLAYNIINISQYEILILCDKGSGIYLDEVINKKDTIKQQSYNLIPNSSKNEIRIPSKQIYTKLLKCGNIKQVKLGTGSDKSKKIYYINKEFIKAEIYLKYVIPSSPPKLIRLRMEFDLKPYKYNQSENNK